MAIQKDPDNKHCKQILATGYACIELEWETPDDVCRFRKSKSNSFHMGGDNNHLELLDIVPRMKGSWLHHLEVRRIASGLCPDRKLCFFCHGHRPIL